MFRWEGCPLELYDVYMEVGEVKESDVKSEECCYIEVWLSSFFVKNPVRKPCVASVRRPVYGIIKQIRKLCGTKPACLILMCDDLSDDTLLWGVAISLLLRHLAPAYALLCVKKTEAETESFVRNLNCRSFKDKETFQNLPTLPDAIVYGCPNRYADRTNASVKSNTPTLPTALEAYLNAAFGS